MKATARFLSPSEAAEQLGISVKALRIYEKRGLIAPGRTRAGWRAYSPDDVTRVAEIVALRGLGLSLGQLARVLDADTQDIEPALAAHQAVLEERLQRLSDAVGHVRRLRERLAKGRTAAPDKLTRLLGPTGRSPIIVDLPWPWGSERFQLPDMRALTYITGPLGSGKTRLARLIADTVPDAAFLGLERLADDGAIAKARMTADPSLKGRVDQALDRLCDDGATTSDALTALIAGLECEKRAIFVIDMVEQGLDAATQRAVIALLRRRGSEARPLFLLTRSSALLDLAAIGIDEAIIYCPANHSPPIRVMPCRGTPGYEAVESCLASPEVRARTDGVIAWRPPATQLTELHP